ncbi:MAG: hypothetical protein AB4426_20710 [Xenococcaceae cyanobacterium]
MANPNPSPQTRYTTDRRDPLTKIVVVKVSESMKAKLNKLENLAEFVRRAIAEKLEKLDCETELQKAG